MWSILLNLPSTFAADDDGFAKFQDEAAVDDIGSDEAVRCIDLDAVMLAERRGIDAVAVAAACCLDKRKGGRQPSACRLEADLVHFAIKEKVDCLGFADLAIGRNVQKDPSAGVDRNVRP
jgi:hypothetical protein